MQRHIPSFTALALSVASMGLQIGTADAADAASTAAQVYSQERADCESGRTSQDRATCLKEAAAAADERKRHGLENTGSARSNATERCKALPLKDRADCVARIEGPTAGNQQVITSGSVSGGGVLRETKTVTIGPAVAVQSAPLPASAPAPSASAPR